jgi:hypothetical protein
VRCAATLINGADYWSAEIKLDVALALTLIAAMPAPALSKKKKKKKLKVVPAPLVETVPTAPPVLEVPPNPTVECKCGKCGAVLMRADESKSYPLLVHCVSCGSYNSTDA